MKRFLSFSLLVALIISAHGADQDEETTGKPEQMKQRALALMEDVAPHAPISDSMVKVFDAQDCAIWGNIFGDGQIGALVAVRPEKANPGEDANLCLLLWQDGWKFAQSAGKVQWETSATQWSPNDTQNWNWGIKRRAPDAPWYVIGSFDLNALSYREHYSWLCDPKTHSLVPTGWPTDAIPSLSGGTITFRRCLKSGYTPTVFEIDEFDGKPGKNLAIYTDEFQGGQSIVTVTMPDSTTGKRITWRIKPPSVAKFIVDHDFRSLCYSPGDGNLEPFHEDATVDVHWGKEPYPNSAINFLVWRLTGIERSAQLGLWDEDVADENEQSNNTIDQKPAQALVTGIPEAVKAFSWPLNPAPQEPGTK